MTLTSSQTIPFRSPSVQTAVNFDPRGGRILMKKMRWTPYDDSVEATSAVRQSDHDDDDES